MDNTSKIMELCRLCLVKDQVNIPIFEEADEIRQTYLKINACLPVKVSREDNLPKKICDGCSYKLDMLYVFWNTSAESEQQLLSWLNGSILPVETIIKTSDESNKKLETIVKQETFDTLDVRTGLDDNTNDKISLNQTSLAFDDFPLNKVQITTSGPSATVTSQIAADEPPMKRARRAAAVKKPILTSTETDEEDDVDTLEPVTKTEGDSEESEVDDNGQDPIYVDVPSTSADDQPGPSGVAKGSIEAPYIESSHFTENYKIREPGPYRCEVCPKSFTTPYLLTKHRREHKVKNVACDLCEKKFKYNFEVTRHKKVVHKMDKEEYICDFCCKQFTSKNTLNVHILTHTKNYKHICSECNTGFLSPKKLQVHYDVEHKGARFTCQYCPKSFKNKNHYKIHVAKHDPIFVKKSYTCPVCFKVVNDSRILRNHERSHGDHYLCDHCGIQITSLCSLKNHLRIHTGEKPYVCSTCGKGFTSRKLLVMHERVHTKEKPFSCNICGKSFSQKGTLNIHVRYHTNERPFQCKICGKSFITGTLLKNHKCRSIRQN